jgi:hypothetical protein
MEGEKAQFVITDPPYNVRIENNLSGSSRVPHKDFAMASGEMRKAEFTGFLEPADRDWMQLNSMAQARSVSQLAAWFPASGTRRSEPCSARQRRY